MRRAALALLAAACGRTGFDPATSCDARAGSAAPVMFVQDNETEASNAPRASASFAVNQLGGDTIVVVVLFGTSITQVVDTSGNAYRLAVGPTGNNGVLQSIYVASDVVRAAAGANVVTVSFAANDGALLRIFEYNGLDGAIDGTAISNSALGVSALATDALTTTSPDLLFVASWCSSVLSAGTPGFGQRLLLLNTLVEELVTSGPDARHGEVACSGPQTAIVQLVPFRRALR